MIIGKHLGSGENEEAYWSAKKLMLYGAIGSVILSTIVIFTSKVYVGIYQVDNVVKSLTVQILYVYAVVVPFKVLNMILGGGIIRSGGRTKYVMFIDMVGAAELSEVVDEQNMSCSLIWSVHGVLVFLWGF